MRLALPAAAALVTIAAAGWAAPDAGLESGASLYQRCAACHLPTGAGVPGFYPPLTHDVRAFARAPDGRRYLILVVTTGAAGAIMVSGKTFNGVMPAQAGLDDAAVAAVLNYITGELAQGGEAPRPFSAEEVAQVRASGTGLSARDVAALGERLPAP
jgi:mono/diheme cytochrome c family protein